MVIRLSWVEYDILQHRTRQYGYWMVKHMGCLWSIHPNRVLAVTYIKIMPT